MRVIQVVTSGPMTTVQDNGRRGYAHLGVGRSGAVDRDSYELANRLVGNDVVAAAIETTFGGLSIVSRAALLVAVTGADTLVLRGLRREQVGSSFTLRPDESVSIGFPSRGVRNYVAIRGGIDADPVLGSRSTDTLSGLGPAPLKDGQTLPIGDATGDFPTVDMAPFCSSHADTVLYSLGPRDDWFHPKAIDELERATWTVDPASNRIGVRLNGPKLERAVAGELPSEGVANGSIQVPPSGPLIFLADHPVTGGYPIIGVVREASLDRVAQLRAGDSIRFARSSSPSDRNVAT